MIDKIITTINTKMEQLESLWMNQLYEEKKEYDKAHLLYPK